MRHLLTGNACEELPSEILDLAAGEGDKWIRLQEVEHALAEKISDNANVIPKVKGVSEMDAFVAVCLVIQWQRWENSQLDAWGISVFLDRADYFHSALGLLLFVIGLDDFAEGALAK